MKKLWWLVVPGVFLAGFAVGQAQPEVSPNLRYALVALKQAKGHLEVAGPDKGGYRAKALKMTNSAIAEVERGIGIH